MIFTRQQLEELEDQNLAPYANHSINSKGRKHPEDEPESLRTSRNIARYISVTVTASSTPVPFGGLNIKPRYSSIMKAIITAHA